MVGRMTFSEPVDPLLLNADTFRIGNANGGPYLDAVVAIAADRRSATLTPTAPLLPFTRYYLQLASIADVAGNAGGGATDLLLHRRRRRYDAADREGDRAAERRAGAARSTPGSPS